MMRRARLAFGFGALLTAPLGVGAALGGCSDLPPEGHVVLHIDTDAPLPPTLRPPPSPRGPILRPQVDPMRAPALFDRLRVEFFSPIDEVPCSACLRDFPLEEGMFARGASVTVRGNADRVRVRLYRSSDQLEGDIAPDTTVEVVARLPRHGEENAVHASVFLSTDKVGQPEGKLDKPIDASLDVPEKSRVGTWPLAKRIACPGAPRTDEVCIPGGAYVMGMTQGLAAPDPTQLGQRIVALAPFYLDNREVTVAKIRAWLERTHQRPESVLLPWNEDEIKKDPTKQDNQCTYGRSDALPINCIKKEAALEYCRSLGGKLPTEAELEYVAGGLQSQRYIWGKDAPGCGDLVWKGPVQPETSQPCSAFNGPLPWSNDSKDRKRDSLPLPSGSAIYDIAGNLSEMTLDLAATEQDDCWPKGGNRVVINPLCTVPSKRPDLQPMVVRGGAWSDTDPNYVRASRRQFADGSVGSLNDLTWIGFRCARR